MIDVIFLRMVQNSPRALRIAILSFYLKQHAFALVSNEEVHFKSTFPSDLSLSPSAAAANASTSRSCHLCLWLNPIFLSQPLGQLAEDELIGLADQVLHHVTVNLIKEDIAPMHLIKMVRRTDAVIVVAQRLSLLRRKLQGTGGLWGVQPYM